MKSLQIITVLFSFIILLIPSILGGVIHETDSTYQQSLLESSTCDQQHIATSPAGGSRYNIQGWVYVNIKGDPYTRGYQYGYLIGEEIIDLMHRWSNMILNHPKIKPIRPLLSDQQYENIASKWWQFCRNLAEQMYWDEYPSEYREEMRGIAAGVTDKGLTLYGNPISYKDVLASNEMYEMLSKLTDRKIRKSIHPLHSFFALIQPTLSKHTESSFSVNEFITDFIPKNQDDIGHHHCSAFIATGDATDNDELIIANSMWSSIEGAGMWWWSYYIAIRWNIILDVIPSEGNRFQMSCAPGYIWSDHDFYQNEEGIVFLETTNPQGIWTENGLPLAVRARKAVQYANSIDDVIYYLKTQNDGIMNAVWLIGDTKTGEIARYELGLYQDAVIERTTDGFQWSSNNPIDFWVRLEKMDWKLFFKQMINYVLFGFGNYQYHTPWYLPASRDIAFEQLGNKYYGKIDIEIVKEIMSTRPISTYSPDCKITSTSLLNNNGLIVHTGNPGGETLLMAYFDSPNVYYTPVEPVGWVDIYGLPEDHDVDVMRNEQLCGLNPIETWMVDLENESNDFYSFSTCVNDTVYTASSSGNLYAVSSYDGEILWSKTIGEDVTKPVVSDDRLYIGSDEGLTVVDLGWLTTNTKPVGDIETVPVISENIVFVGVKSGKVMAIDQNSGMILWQHSVDGVPYLSEVENGIIIVTAGTIVHAFDSNSGMILWTKQLQGVCTSRAFQDEGRVFIGSWDTNLYALNQLTGDQLWTFDTGWGIESTPVINEKTVFFGSHDQNMYALNKSSGKIEWVSTCHAGIHTSPVLWNESVLIGSDDGRLYRLEQENGTLLWCFDPGRSIQGPTRNYETTPIRSSVAVTNDHVMIGVLGSLYAMH